MFSMRVLVCSLLAGWAFSNIEAASAAPVFSDTVLVNTPEFLTVLELPLDSVGAYKVTATDLEWLEAPLQALSFGVFTATEKLESRQGPGALDFFKAGAEKVYLQVYARTAGPTFAGLVGVKVDPQAPVPLPAPLLLLGSALGAGMLARRVQRARTRV